MYCIWPRLSEKWKGHRIYSRCAQHIKLISCCFKDTVTQYSGWHWSSQIKSWLQWINHRDKYIVNKGVYKLHSSNFIFLLELPHSKGFPITWKNVSSQVHQVIPTLGGVWENSMTSALYDRWFWRLLAALSRMRLPMINVFTLFLQWVPPRNVVKLRDTG